jgi:hypothetical protein
MPTYEVGIELLPEVTSLFTGTYLSKFNEFWV